MPKVSVLVTLFNRERFIEETLRSILGSTYADFELIVVDDQSTDSSLDIVKGISPEDQRILWYENEKNLGDYRNRIKAASLATGKYLKYIDSDDLIYPHSLAIMVEGMEAHPEAVLGLSHSMPEDVSPYPWQLEPDEAYRKQFLGRGCLNCGPSGAIINREAFQSAGGFDSSWGVLADTELWLRIAMRSPVVLFPPGLVWWRRHEGQEFTRGGADLVYLRRGYELNRKMLEDPACPLSPSERSQALVRCRQHFSRRLLSLALRRRQPRVAYEAFRNSGLDFRSLLSGFLPYRQ